MKYSIIIPAHNSEQYIQKALQSVREQTFKDYELIVICDSCTDNTEKIVKDYGAITKAVNYQNIGMTRNEGLDMATGEYILFLDDDDWFLHEFVLQQLDEQVGNADVIVFGFIWRHRGYTHPFANGGAMYPAVWAKCWKRSAIGDVRFPEEFPEDIGFNKLIFQKELKIRMFNMPLYYYNYWREGSFSRETNQVDLRIIK